MDHKMHITPDDFTEKISSIKNAEAEAAKIIAQSSETAASTLSQARARSAKIASETTDLAAAAKDKAIQAVRKKIDAQVEKIVTDAKHESKKFQGAKLPAAKSKKLALLVLEG
ncbi:MAG TPA: hypothetical protein PLO51_05355 [Candidatus Micrarchaeota archaeon]|nr:hypothetical protein [Candidatus Micrarchaeota archaeon]